MDFVDQQNESSQSHSTQALSQRHTNSDAHYADMVDLRVRQVDDNMSQPRSRRLSLEEPAFEPPNGGIHAYLKVLGCFFVFFITLGFASTFGSYQAHYEETILHTYSPSTISWIGTTQLFLLSFVGTFSGAFYDRGYVHEILITGFGLIVLGLCMLSLAQNYWHIVITQGICIGLGGGLIYVPAVSIVSNYFTTKRASALGISATGSAIGGVLWPIMFRELLPPLGFGWVNRVFGFLTLFLAVTSYFLLTSSRLSSPLTHQQRQPLNIPQLHSHNSWMGLPHLACAIPKSFTNLLSTVNGSAYLFLCTGIFFVFLGYWIPLFYVIPFASGSLGASPSYASNLLSILNAGSLFGRVAPAYLGQVIGTAFVLLLGATTLGVLVLVWLSVGNIPGITVWCFFIGFTSGIVVSIPNAVASRLSSRSNVGLRIGIMWTVGAFAELIGAPIAGALVTGSGHTVSYVGGQIFGGLSILIGAIFLVIPAWSIFKDNKVRAARNS